MAPPKRTRKRRDRLVASVAAFDEDGNLLFGLRDDVHRWTMPGGHFEVADDELVEDPLHAAVRELREETGLKPLTIKYLGHGVVRKLMGNVRVFCFRATVSGKPHGEDDPDQECSTWKFVDVKDGIPAYIADHLHAKNNITLRLLGLQDGEVRKTEAWNVDTSEHPPDWSQGDGQAWNTLSADLRRRSWSAYFEIKGENANNLHYADHGANAPPDWWEPREPGRGAFWENFSHEAKKIMWGKHLHHLEEIERKVAAERAENAKRREADLDSPYGSDENRSTYLDKNPMEKDPIEEMLIHAPGTASSTAAADQLLALKMKGVNRRHLQVAIDWAEQEEVKDALLHHKLTDRRHVRNMLVVGHDDFWKTLALGHPLVDEAMLDEASDMVEKWQQSDQIRDEFKRALLKHPASTPDQHVRMFKKSRLIRGSTKMTYPKLPAGFIHDELKAAGKNDNLDMIDDLLDHPNCDRDTVADVVKLAKVYHDKYARWPIYKHTLFKHPLLDPEQMKDLLHTPKWQVDPSWRAGRKTLVDEQSMLENPNCPVGLVDDFAHLALAHQMPATMVSVLKSPKSGPQHIDSAIKMLDQSGAGEVARAIRSSPHLTDEQVSRLVNDPKSRGFMAASPRLTDEQVKGYIDEGEWGSEMVDHPSLTKQQLLHAAQSPHRDSAQLALQYRAGTDADIVDLSAKNPDPFIRTLALQHPNVSLKTLQEAVGREKSDVLEPGLAQAERQMRIDPEMALAARNHAEPAIQAIGLRHPSASPEELQRFSSHPTLARAVAGNPSIDPDTAVRLAQSKDLQIVRALAQNPKLPEAGARELWNMRHNIDEMSQEFSQTQSLLLNNPRTPDDVLADMSLHPSMFDEVLRHRRAGPQTLARMKDWWKNSDIPPAEAQSWLEDVPHSAQQLQNIEALRQSMQTADPNTATMAHADMRQQMLTEKWNALTPDQKHEMAMKDTWTRALMQRINKVAEKHSPDEAYSMRVAVRPGMQKLRKIRDIINAKAGAKGEIRAQDLPPGDWNVGRLPNGNISAKKIEQHIDSQAPLKFNVSLAEWRGAQRHSREPSKVLQVNLTNDQVNRMKDAGVYDTFRKVSDDAHASAHPVRPSTIGWIRYTGTPDTGFFIDEIQSDFGQSFVKQAMQQAHQMNMTPEQAQKMAEKELPETHYNTIRSILFGNKHPNELLHEAFHEFHRQLGHHDTPVHIHTVESKAPISLGKPIAHRSKAPGHFNVTYHDSPKKMGYEPGTYGKLPTETGESDISGGNETHIGPGAPVWESKIRKYEDEAAIWLAQLPLVKMATRPSDLRGVARSDDTALGQHNVDGALEHDQHPAEHEPYVQAFKRHVIDDPKPVKRAPTKAATGGKVNRWTGKMEGGNANAKAVYSVDEKIDNQIQHRFMVKPYHEKITRYTRPWQQHLIQGWAEMTNQALYHAGEIGHLHQKVHVATLPLPESKSDMRSRVASLPAEQQVGAKAIAKHAPTLVVHMQPNTALVADLAGDFTRRLDTSTRADVKKITLMDFLTNNLDRHGGNLLWDFNAGRYMAIDHSRSFQYKCFGRGFNEKELKKPTNSFEDNLANYMGYGHAHGNVGCGVKVADPRPYKDEPLIDLVSGVAKGTRRVPDREQVMKEWQPVIEKWWPQVRGRVVAALDKRVEMLKDEKLRGHIRKNFMARVDQLDDYARHGIENFGTDTWHTAFVPIHRYGVDDETPIENQYAP